MSRLSATVPLRLARSAAVACALAATACPEHIPAYALAAEDAAAEDAESDAGPDAPSDTLLDGPDVDATGDAKEPRESGRD